MSKSLLQDDKPPVLWGPQGSLLRASVSSQVLRLFTYQGCYEDRKDNVCKFQFSCSVVSNSLWPYELQHSRPPCPSPTPGVHPNPCPLSQWCHRTISSSVVPFFSQPQSFPASGSFQMSQLFASGGQSIGVSASTTVLPMNIQDWFQGSYHFLKELQVTNWMNWVNGKQSDYQRWLLLRRLSSSWSSS